MQPGIRAPPCQSVPEPALSLFSEALGHTDVKTTESYLDSFENETKKHFAGTLTAFKNEAGGEKK